MRTLCANPNAAVGTAASDIATGTDAQAGA
jgi:hypothetical protein